MFSKLKILFLLVIAMANLLIFSVAPVSAQIGGLTNRPVSEIIMSAVNWLLSVTAGLAILFIVIGGVYYITAAGDDQRMETGKTMITYAIIGLVFVVISYSIIITVNNIIAG